MKLFKASLLLISLIVHQSLVWAQHGFIKIVDDHEQTIPSASVVQTSLTDTNQTSIGTINSGGKVPIAYDGSVKVCIHSFGFEDLTDTIPADHEDHDVTFELGEKSHELGEAIVTAQLSPSSPENAVHTIRVINKKRIEQQGAVNLRDVLANEMNIRISQDNILGSGMSMQGTSGENIKILIDGVPVIGRLGGNIDLSQINMNNVERIEIVEGPLSVSYGSNALGGTVNIITEKNQKETLTTSIDNYLESVGQYNFNVASGWKHKQAFLSLNAGRNHFNGWSENDTSRFLQWKPKEQYFARGQVKQSFENTTLRWTGEVFNEKITNKGAPRQPFYETAFDDYYYTTRINNSVFLKHYFKNDNTLDITAAYNYFSRVKNTYFKDLTTLKEKLTTNDGDQDTSRFHLLMSRGMYNIIPDSSKIHSQFGYDISHETAEGKRIAGEVKSITDIAIYANIEWQALNKVMIRPGLRYAYNSGYKTPLVPSLHVKYKAKSSTWRLSWARGFRAPALKELYFVFVDINHNIIGNPDLKAEKSDNFQLAWAKELTLKKVSLTLKTSLFYNDIRNLITLAQSTQGPEFTYINVGKHKTMGWKGDIQAEWKNINWAFGGAFSGIYNQLSEVHDISSFSYSPELRSSISYNWKLRNINVALFYKYNGLEPGFFLDENDELQSSFITSYQLLDLSITKQFWNEYLKITAGAKNLLNVKNVRAQSAGGNHSSSASNTPVGWGRSLFAHITLKF